MNGLATIKKANRLRLEQVADTFAEAAKAVITVGDEKAFASLRNAIQLHTEFKDTAPVGTYDK